MSWNSKCHGVLRSTVDFVDGSVRQCFSISQEFRAALRQRRRLPLEIWRGRVCGAPELGHEIVCTFRTRWPVMGWRCIKYVQATSCSPKMSFLSEHEVAGCQCVEVVGMGTSQALTFHLSARPPQTPSQILLAERAGQSKPEEFCAVMADILQCLSA